MGRSKSGLEWHGATLLFRIELLGIVGR